MCTAASMTFLQHHGPPTQNLIPFHLDFQSTYIHVMAYFLTRPITISVLWTKNSSSVCDDLDPSDLEKNNFYLQSAITFRSASCDSWLTSDDESIRRCDCDDRSFVGEKKSIFTAKELGKLPKTKSLTSLKVKGTSKNV